MSRPPDPLYIFRGAGSSVSSLKFQNNEVLYSGHHNGQVHVWSMKSCRPVAVVSAHNEHSCLWIDFTEDGQMLTQGREGNLKKWSMTEADWEEVGSVTTSDMGFCKGCVVNRKQVAMPSPNTSQVDLYDIDLMKITSSLKPDQNIGKFGMCMCIKSGRTTENETKVFIGYEDGSIAFWDIRMTRLVHSVKLHEECVMGLDFSDKLARGYSGSVNQSLHSWQIDFDKIMLKDTACITNPGVNDMAVRDDGKIIVTAGWDSRVRVFGAKRLKPLAVLDYHKESVHCVAFSDDQLLACGSKDQLISLWDIYR